MIGRIKIKTNHLLLSCLVFTSYPANIIFDLGDVLIETQHRKALWHIGPLKLFYYASTWRNPLTCRETFYDFLQELKDHSPLTITTKDSHGIELPALMCDWLKGIQPPAVILEHINQTIALQKSPFGYHPEQIIIKAIAELVFTPELLINTSSLIVPGFNFAKECKQHGHKLYILSNWDPHSFELLQEEYPALFSLFDGILISGHIGLIKPDPAIYHYLLTTYNLKPEECVFIDDQSDNIQTANRLGIYGIHYCKKKGLIRSSHDFSSVRKKLYHLLNADLSKSS